MRTVMLRCPRCNKLFRVLEDEQFDHGCPHCHHGLPEHAGIDYYGNEILQGDEIVIADGEVVLKEDLEKFLSEVYGFEFKQAE